MKSDLDKASSVLHDLKPPPTLTETALQAIKESIVYKVLKPGVLYTELAIAKQLGISKTPVREALINLSSRGFVTIIPRKGFQVNQLSESNIEEIFEFRVSLEEFIVKRVIENLDEASLEKLESILDRSETTEDKKDFLKLDKEFHSYLALLSGNRYAMDASRKIWDLCEWVGAEVFMLRGRPESASKEHRELLESLKQRDLEAAVRSMKNHIANVRKLFLQIVKSTK